nr:Septation ring formation regulator EzrA like [Ipomoea batatas]
MSAIGWEYHKSGMLSKEQLLRLFDRFAFLTSQSDVKQRIADAVKDKQEAVAVTTAIQEEIFLEMGIDPRFGLACLGKVNMVYENDQDLMIRFYGFVAKEEMACEEAELGPNGFAEKMHMQHNLQERQLEMLKYMRNFHLDDQSAIIDKVRLKMEMANFDSEASVLSMEKMQVVVSSKVAPLF